MVGAVISVICHITNGEYAIVFTFVNILKLKCGNVTDLWHDGIKILVCVFLVLSHQQIVVAITKFVNVAVRGLIGNMRIITRI